MPTTSVYVTHDQVEAMTLGDRVVVMKDGRVQQVGTPLEIYGARQPVRCELHRGARDEFHRCHRPQCSGATSVEAEGLRLTVGPAEASALAAHAGRRVVMGMRPEHLVLGDGAPGLGFDARVEVVEQLGSEILLETRVGGATVTAARVPAEAVIARGDQVRLSAQPGRLHFFDAESELPIST